MEPLPPEIEFEHHRAGPGALPTTLSGARVVRLQARLGRRAQLSRALFVVAGAAAVAWGSQRAGLALPAALCLFFGVLPVLWVGGWLFGFVFHARREVARVGAEVGSTRWQGALAAAAVTERVRLAVREEALEVTRGEVSRRYPWRGVRVERPGPEALAVLLGEAEPGGALAGTLLVPRSAFASDGAFDDFCLAMQRRVWQAQRPTLTSPRA